MELMRPAVVADLKDVVDVVAGGMHTLCLTADGKVWSFGCNDEGALGRRTSSLDGSETTPGTVEIPELVARVTAGDSHSAALTESGKVYLWGNFRDSKGQMGLITPGKAEPEPKLVISNIVQIASGIDHVAMLTAKGELLTMGCGEQGQLGWLSTRTETRRWKLVSGGKHHTLLLSEEGSVFSLGRKEYGRLGLGTSTPANNDDQATPFQVPGLSGCVDISCGEAVSYAIDGEGRLHSWGFGTNGQLGHGGDDDLFEPKVVAGKFAGKKTLVVSGGGQHAVMLAT
ncbi:hypothetical protein HPB50_011597 [Hyalomma asiaticum]|uniref:Uncharacterized protein n=1 Tax=Hyalomma asiaticum TaxID=266040 RepID=A0ACB7TJ84_HYAAI|nr:hypothetical protein HPB50_011597 [Hyalomma asiaticum]